MANQNNMNYGNNMPRPMGYPTGGSGMGYGAPRPSGGPSGNGGKKGGKGKKKKAKKDRQIAERKVRARTLRDRQKYAIENSGYRRRVEAVNGSRGIDPSYYRLPDDIKPKRRGKDYFFVMRKLVCFLMFLVLLISVAYYALGYVKIEAIPEQYLALYMETAPKATKPSDSDKTDGENNGDETGDETGGEENAANADIFSVLAAEGEDAGDNADGEGDKTEDGGDKTASSKEFEGTTYGVLDPIFGFVKYIGRKVLNMDLSKIGESPLYDSMIGKYEVGMQDTIAQYVILAFPVGLILYVVIALIMMLKAFFGMFGRRIFKCFGLGSILMIICAALAAFGGLAFTTPINGKLNYADIVNILIGGITGTGGFTGGYGLLILFGLPVITLILSMFCRKKVPYSIFDTFGE